MAPTRLNVSWNGLDAFKDELANLPAELEAEASTIFLESAEDAKNDIFAHYPHRTGNLRRGLILRPVRGQHVVGQNLIQRAPHGWIYERGTKTRKTKAGANRGRVLPNPTFLPIAQAYRRSAISAILFRLYQHGASRVTGDAET